MLGEGPDSGTRRRISVLILTFNEEINLADCLESVPWRDDIFVIDSGSTDRTLEIANQYKAKIVRRPFDGYAKQRNYGLSQNFENEWILMLDADERCTPELAVEIEAFIKSAGSNTSMAMVRRKDIFLGKWLKRSSGYPTWFPRIFRKGRVVVSREVNEIYETNDQSVLLKEHLLHYPFNKGLDYWIERHNKYSSLEAGTLQSARKQSVDWLGAISTDPQRRRAFYKRCLYGLPMRPFWVFLFLYFFRLGFLDGRAGYCFVMLRCSYEAMLEAKLIHNDSSRQ